MIELFLLKFWPWLLGVAALIAGFFASRQSGKRAERRKQLQQQLKARQEADDVVQETASMDDDTVLRSLSKWVRKPKR